MPTLTLVAAAAMALIQPQMQPLSRPEPLNPSATEPFERDPDLQAWAVRMYDRNRDGWLSLYEAQPALRSLKEIADADRDGRVTVREFEAAKAFIRARWARSTDQ